MTVTIRDLVEGYFQACQIGNFKFEDRVQSSKDLVQGENVGTRCIRALYDIANTPHLLDDVTEHDTRSLYKCLERKTQADLKASDIIERYDVTSRFSSLAGNGYADAARPYDRLARTFYYLPKNLRKKIMESIVSLFKEWQGKLTPEQEAKYSEECKKWSKSVDAYEAALDRNVSKYFPEWRKARKQQQKAGNYVRRELADRFETWEAFCEYCKENGQYDNWRFKNTLSARDFPVSKGYEPLPKKLAEPVSPYHPMIVEKKDIINEICDYYINNGYSLEEVKAELIRVKKNPNQLGPASKLKALTLERKEEILDEASASFRHERERTAERMTAGIEDPKKKIAILREFDARELREKEDRARAKRLYHVLKNR